MLHQYSDTNYGQTARRFKNINLLPYMSLEAMSEDASRFPALICGRVKYSSEEWVYLDDRAMRFQWGAGSFEVKYCNRAIIMKGEKYGQLTEWTFDSAHRGYIMGFPKAELVLQAQAQLLKVLRGIAEVLPCQAPTAIERPLHYDVDSSLAERKSVEYAGLYLDTIAQVYAFAPTFNLEKLVSNCEARLHLTEDHLLQLQTDPAYLRRYMGLVQKLQMNNVKGTGKHAATAMDLDHDIWTARYWRWLLEEATELSIVQRSFRGSFDPEGPLPTKYEARLVSFEKLLLELIDSQSRHIQAVLPQRPGFSHIFDFIFTKEGVMDCRPKYWQESKFAKMRADAEHLYKDPLHFTLLGLTLPPDSDGHGGNDALRLADLLEYHLSTCSEEERARLDETLYRKYSDLTQTFSLSYPFLTYQQIHASY